MLPRILSANLASGRLTLDPASSHHLAVVLRIRPGDPLVIFNGQGQEGRAVMVQANKAAAVVEVGAIATITRESPLGITVVQALCTGDKMDWVVQKATELGAARIIPVAAARSVLKLDGSRAEKRIDHWKAIAQAASGQCGRTVVPDITSVMSFTEVIADWTAQASPKTGWLLDPFAQDRLSEASMSGAVTLMIGPEAGWTDEEEALAKRVGMKGVQVGPRILRTETAAAVVLTAIAMKCGEF
ncbi:MAG: 16S rRNA (uracil(1498)-N(3))-methyltransferase [Burkholderiaceae bacterium]|nr:16S rRNA (uracil(1498)-N(3))-methyltransferase [Burkholderiaceae bacterium]